MGISLCMVMSDTHRGIREYSYPSCSVCHNSVLKVSLGKHTQHYVTSGA